MENVCPNCQSTLTFSDDSEKVFCASCGYSADLNDKTRVLSVPPLTGTELKSGDELGRYKIIKFLGRGGMGTVYEASDPILKRHVALKLLNEELAHDESFVKRFDREAEHLARLQHQGVVKVLDRGFDRGWPFLVMELVEGDPLRREMNQGKMSLDRVLYLIKELTRTLDYSHSKGVVHRDIKPENILIDSTTREPKLTDFGLSKTLQQQVVETRITMTNILMGTLDYMAPEQRRDKGSVNHQSDLYSLGVVFYEMLTGDLPVGAFEMPSQKVASPQWIDSVISKLLATHPEKRYQSALDLLNDLNNPSHIKATKEKVVEHDSKFDQPLIKQPKEFKGEVAMFEETQPLDLDRGSKNKFNWISIILCVIVLLMVTASFPISWAIVSSILLLGIQNSRREKDLVAKGHLKPEQQTARFMTLSTGYWIKLLTSAFVLQPHEDNWYYMNKYLNGGKSFMGAQTATETPHVVTQSFHDIVSEVARIGPSIPNSVMLMLVLTIPLTLFFVLSRKNKNILHEENDHGQFMNQKPPSKAKISGIYRNLDQRVLGGVCSGLAHKLNMTVGGVRLLMFMAIFFFGLPLLIYPLLWILIPGHPISQYEQSSQTFAHSGGSRKNSTLGGGCLIASVICLATLMMLCLVFLFSASDSKSMPMESQVSYPVLPEGSYQIEYESPNRKSSVKVNSGKSRPLETSQSSR